VLSAEPTVTKVILLDDQGSLRTVLVQQQKGETFHDMVDRGVVTILDVTGARHATAVRTLNVPLMGSQFPGENEETIT
jgi:hypothetical protein